MSALLLPRYRNGTRVTWCLVGHVEPYKPGSYRDHAATTHVRRPRMYRYNARSPLGEDPTRNAAIAAAVAGGLRTLGDIGAEFGITRERVRQIAGRAGVDRDHKPVPLRPRVGARRPCRTCGVPVPVGSVRQHRLDAGHTTSTHARLTGHDLGLLREFYGRGLGFASLGAVFGVNPMSIKHRLQRLGVPLHSTGRIAGINVDALKVEMRSRRESPR